MIKRNWTLEELVAWVETVEPKEVAMPQVSRPAAPREMSSPAAATSEELRQEADEWQAVRVAFEARSGGRSPSQRQKAR
jgi:hypothetical protein